MSDRFARLLGLLLVALSAVAGWLIGVVDRMPVSPERNFGQLSLALTTILSFIVGLGALVKGGALFGSPAETSAIDHQDGHERRRSDH